MTEPKRNNLIQFFGAYFHQDWRFDDPTPDAVIKRFVENNPEHEVEKVVVELDELLSMSLTEEELRRMLFEEYLCYYIPTENSIRDWLSHVRVALSVRT
jgi:hypothetical protein